MRRPKKLPPIEVLESLFTYDPCTGALVCRKSGDELTGLTVRIGSISTSVSRICFALYYRKNLSNYRIMHIDGNNLNNTIVNLSAKKVT